MGDEERSEPNKGGRPRKFAAGTRNPTLAFRARGDLYDRIRDSASERGVSLSQEIERRLDVSFDRGGVFGSPETYGLMLSMAQRLQSYERRFGKPWIEIEDPRFHMAAGRAFQEQIALLQADVDLRPLSAEEANRTNDPVAAAQSGKAHADSGIELVEGEKWVADDDGLPDDDHEGSVSRPIVKRGRKRLNKEDQEG